MSFKVLVIDNYDSFVYNLVQYLGELKAEPIVKRNDAITIEEAEKIASVQQAIDYINSHSKS